MQDSASSIQRLYIGQSGHQKLDLLNELVMCLGYEGLAGAQALSSYDSSISACVWAGL